MKKFLLLFILSSVCSFGGTLKGDVMKWLRAFAKKPYIDVENRGIFISPELFTISLTNRVAFDQTISALNTNTTVSVDIVNEILSNNCKAVEAEMELNDIFPSLLLPVLFNVLEEGSFGTNECFNFYATCYRDNIEDSVGLYCGEKISIKRNRIYQLVGSYICDKLNVLTESKDWYLTEIWVKYIPPGVNNKCPPATCHFPYFWWYEGRKYATNIWSDFYRCWQYEQARTTPREGVLDQLAKEIAELGICAIPIVKDAIDGGDNTLAPVLKALAVKLGEGGLTNQSFSSWYSENASKYILPPCEGLEAAKLRITDTNYVNELNGIMNLGQPGHKTVRTYDGYANFMNVFRAEMSAYYTNRPAVPDYWYYKLPDDVLEFDASVAYDLDRNCTNFNPRYLIPSN